jgi:hypothetical protein
MENNTNGEAMFVFFAASRTGKYAVLLREI